MTDFLTAAAVLLLATIAAGLWRIYRGPTPCDRMMAAQLFGTTGVAILLILAEVSGTAAARDAALTFALLAAVAGAMFVFRPLSHVDTLDDDPDFPDDPAHGEDRP